MLPNKKKAGILGKVRSRLSFRPMVYGYANARVRAMRPSLVARRQYEDLLKVHTNAAVAEYLSHTSYRNDFGSMPPKITDEERVELAISRNFARTAQKILRIAPTESKATLKAILSRYDVHNLKAVLLSKKLGKNIEEMRRLLVPAGDTSQKELEQIFNAGNADELYASIRGTEFGAKFLSSASIKRLPRAQIKLLFQNPSDEGKLELFLSSLDIYYYEMAASAVGAGEKDASIILGLLRSEADVKNITTAMRLKRGGADKKTGLEHFVGGGSRA
ncbi:MAG: V-type ATPase subunit [Candidatus Micrarchaeota archaeon]|nr:V-type ATPase subunit [Candidatus Micrarchaeota archaeon]